MGSIQTVACDGTGTIASINCITIDEVRPRYPFIFVGFDDPDLWYASSTERDMFEDDPGDPFDPPNLFDHNPMDPPPPPPPPPPPGDPPNLGGSISDNVE